MTHKQGAEEIKENILKARNQLVTSPLLERFSLEFVTESTLWGHYDAELFSYYPRDIFFREEKLYDDKQLEKAELSDEKVLGLSYLKDSILIKERDVVVGLFHGWQKKNDSYYMQVSAIHRDYRRLGIYSALLERIIQYTGFLGFSTIVSCHSPANNNILIAKLKKDFKITSLEIDPMLGINIWLCYFHNKEMLRAYEFRSGHSTFSSMLYAASEGTAEELYQALNNAKNLNNPF